MANQSDADTRISVESLRSPWFGTDHGTDNFDEAIDLSQVQAIRASWTPEQIKVHSDLKGGGELDATLSEKGYDALLTALNALRSN